MLFLPCSIAKKFFVSPLTLKSALDSFTQKSVVGDRFLLPLWPSGCNISKHSSELKTIKWILTCQFSSHRNQLHWKSASTDSDIGKCLLHLPQWYYQFSALICRKFFWLLVTGIRFQTNKTRRIRVTRKPLNHRQQYRRSRQKNAVYLNFILIVHERTVMC